MKLEQSNLTLDRLKGVQRNLPVARLYEEVVRNGEGDLAPGGPIVTRTGRYTGRSADDKFVVLDSPEREEEIWWEGGAHRMEPAVWERLLERQKAYLQGRQVYVRDCWAGADKGHRLAVRVINQHAWHNLFASNMFIAATPEELETFEPEFTVLHTPDFKANPELDGTRSEAFVGLNFARNLVLIGGTSYAGEIKKSIFTVLNYKLPKEGVLGMHCSANVGCSEGEDAALFFGLSGTGKTTLSADSSRRLIGDDEHGWGTEGVFNFEGGCYAKVIRLSAEAEPEIYATTSSYGTLLENVIYDPETRVLDLDDAELTQNTRASYPLTSIPNIQPGSVAGHPKTVIMLTCDAFGVLPPISRMTPEQAMYHFISGYTAKVAGTERGVDEPEATFSACFGAPFMPLHPRVYAELLGEKIATHGASCWLVNTGWSGGPVGAGGARMKIAYSRALINAALSGELNEVETRVDPVFGFEVPLTCTGVPAEVLDPKSTWADGAAYDVKAAKLAEMFAKNFENFAEGTSEAICQAGPQAQSVS